MGRREAQRKRQGGEGHTCSVQTWTCTCAVHVSIIGRESGSDTERGETEGGRNGVRQGKNEERKEATPGIAVQCENKYKLHVVYTCACTCLYHLCTFKVCLSLHPVLPQYHWPEHSRTCLRSLDIETQLHPPHRLLWRVWYNSD